MSQPRQRGFTIHDLPQAERPRERLQRLGPEALSSQELIALVLGRGVKGESVMVTAQRLLSTFGNLKNISEASLEELSSVKGVGLAKAAQLKAAFALAERAEDSSGERVKIKTASDVVRLVRARLRDKKKEHFMILCLDTKNSLIKASNVSMGTLNASLVHPREVFKEAIQSLAHAIILVHNHPSGNPMPSDADIEITRRIIDAGRIVGIDVLDHVIIARERAFSFKEKGLI